MTSLDSIQTSQVAKYAEAIVYRLIPGTKIPRYISRYIGTGHLHRQEQVHQVDNLQDYVTLAHQGRITEQQLREVPVMAFHKMYHQLHDKTFAHFVFMCNRYPKSYMNVVRELNFPLNGRDSWGNTPLLWAVANAESERALQLLSYGKEGADIGINIPDTMCQASNPLILAVRKGRRDEEWDQLVDALIPQSDVNFADKHGWTALHCLVSI